jgi:RNA polymerase nonessential primary-like sigma factor
MPNDLIKSYLQKIGRYPLLTPEEEIFYAKQVQAMVKLERQTKALALKLGRKPSADELSIFLGITEKEMELIRHRGLRAKNCIATANLRLVVTIAKKYQNFNIDLIDLIQEGSLGLYASIEKFDPSKGYKFSTYSYWWIRQGITRAIAQKSRIISLPVNLVEKLHKVRRIQKELFQLWGRFPTVVEIAQATKLSEEKVRECLKYSNHPVSLNLCIGKDKDSELGDFLEADEKSLVESVDQELLRENLKSIMSSLTAVQREVLSLRYGINSDKALTLDQIGERLHLCKERVRQIQNQAIVRLRQQYGRIEYSF